MSWSRAQHPWPQPSCVTAEYQADGLSLLRPIWKVSDCLGGLLEHAACEDNFPESVRGGLECAQAVLAGFAVRILSMSLDVGCLL